MFLTCRTVQKGGLLGFAIMTSCVLTNLQILFSSKNLKLTFISRMMVIFVFCYMLTATWSIIHFEKLIIRQGICKMNTNRKWLLCLNKRLVEWNLFYRQKRLISVSQKTKQIWIMTLLTWFIIRKTDNYYQNK